MFKKEGGNKQKNKRKKAGFINKIDFKLPDRAKYNQLQRK